jgi:hypothetical protein
MAIVEPRIVAGTVEWAIEMWSQEARPVRSEKSLIKDCWGAKEKKDAQGQRLPSAA